jgi:hypothetical protein
LFHKRFTPFAIKYLQSKGVREERVKGRGGKGEREEGHKTRIEEGNR